MRGDAIEALCFDAQTGQVRAYLPEEFRDIYDADPDVEFGLRAGERSIYEIYLEPDGTRKKLQVEPSRSNSIMSAGQAPFAQLSPVPPTGKGRPEAPSTKTPTRLSAARNDFLASRRIAKGDGRAEEDAGLIIDFMIDFIGDKSIADITSDELHAFEIAMAMTPDRARIPKANTTSLLKRHAYAQAHGFEGLKMLSEKRVSNVWHRCLHQFFKFLKDKGKGEINYHFDLLPANATLTTKRDAWTDEEMLKLFSLPLFTGCASKDHIWTAGTCFVQNELYWAYLLIFFTGMRNSEIATLHVKNLVCDSGVWMFDLGTKPRRTVKRQESSAQSTTVRRKSAAGHRRIPIPLLLIDLGILSRAEDLRGAGASRRPRRGRRAPRPPPSRD